MSGCMTSNGNRTRRTFAQLASEAGRPVENNNFNDINITDGQCAMPTWIQQRMAVPYHIATWSQFTQLISSIYENNRASREAQRGQSRQQCWQDLAAIAAMEGNTGAIGWQGDGTGQSRAGPGAQAKLQVLQLRKNGPLCEGLSLQDPACARQH